MPEACDIIQWNCEGILPKKGDLEAMVAERKPLCVCAQETKLPYTSNCKLPGYKQYLQNLRVGDGENAHGGVAIFIRKEVSAFKINLNTTLQAVAVSMKLNKRITVCSIYLPPGENIQRQELEQLINQLPRPFLLLGDFNARSRLWYDSEYSSRGKMVEKLIEEGDYFFLDKNENTHFSRRHKTFSHVDLSLCSIDLIDSFKWEVDEDFHNSDHAPIYLTSNCPRPSGRGQRWIPNKANWEKYQELTDVDMDIIQNTPDIDTMANMFETMITDAADQTVPKSKGTGNRQSPPWWNNACLTAIRKRKSAWRKYKRNSTDENYNYFSRLRAEAQRIIRHSKRKAWTDLIESINPNTESSAIWRKIKLLGNKLHSEAVTTLKIDTAKILVIKGQFDTKEIIRILRTFGSILEVQKNGASLSVRFEKIESSQAAKDQLNGGQYNSMNIKAELLGKVGDSKIYDKPEDLANCLGRRFEFVSSGYNCDDNFNRNRKRRENNLDFTTARKYGYNEKITRKEMDSSLDNSTDSTPGPDGIHYSMLKNLSEKGKIFLLEFINKIFDAGKLPKKWKVAYVIPILKEGKNPLSPDSYRPIALTSCICKLLEKILNKRLMWYLIKNNLIDRVQCGFQKLKSTLDNLAGLEKEIHNAFVKKQFLLAIFFDLEKAYDTCWRHLILQELHSFGMRGKLPLLIMDFLKDRIFKVRIGNTYSKEFSQEMGVPQGSVLSVTLFLIAINTVMRVITGQVNVSLYVDDMRFSIASQRLESATRRMQTCLRKLDTWTEQTGFRFSTSKTEVVVFHRQRGLYEDPNPELYLRESKIKVVTEKKFLGLIFDQKLTWIPHIINLKARAIRALNILKIIVKNNTKTETKLLLNIYRALVRSKLDYGCQIYGTASPSAVKMLDTVHHQALRLCTGAFRTSPVESIYVEAGEPSLKDRRMSLQLQYYVRTKQIPVDRTIVKLDDEACDHLYQAVKNKPKSLGYKVRQDLQELQIDIPAISIYTESEIGPWEQPEIMVCMSLALFSKEATSPEEFIQSFRAHRHDVDFEIYTDGSKTNSGVGAGFGILSNVPGNGFTSRSLHPMSSVFSAELYAIKLALLTLRVYQDRSVVIYSDSRSALQAVVKMGSTNKLIQEIHELIAVLSRQQVKVLFCWIPSHVGIEGNELADAAAKHAAQSGTIHRHEVSGPDVIAHIKNTMKKRWEDCWQNIGTNKKLRNIQQTLKTPTLTLSRKDKVKLTRLRIGHTRLTHGHLLIGEDQPVCIECTWDEDDPQYLTVEHILMECGNLALDRTPFFDPINVSLTQLLTEQHLVEKVLEFLRHAEIYNKI